MNAFQPSRPPLEPVKPRRVARQRKNHRRRLYQLVALENTAKLAVNVVLSAAAVCALVQLVPYFLSQQEKLREIQTEVSLIEGQVNNLQTDFNRYFDPRQAKSIMQEQSLRVEPGQRQVVWQDKEAKEVKATPSR